MNELKLRLILFAIGIFLVGTGHFLSGSWRDEDLGNGAFIPGEPVFEFDVRKSTCENGWCNMGISSNIVLGLLGVMIGMGSFCPIKLTNDVKVAKSESKLKNGVVK